MRPSRYVRGVATRVRDWATVDYYDLLGVSTDASGDDIARAFRAAAKRSHPDASNDPDAAEQFKDLAAAYAVLSNRRTRRDYDGVRAGSTAASVVPSMPRAAAAAPTRWTPERAWLALIGGIVITVLGVGASYLTWYLRDRDASERARFVSVAAQRVDNGEIAFDTSDGRHVVVPEPRQHGEGTKAGPTVDVRYDPANPRHVVVDASTFGRDITLAIVAVKLLIGGPVFAVLGARRLRKLPRAVR
ncbi:MAG: molecular chaperone DnaJ [Actinomycetota bacterium]|nr:molecular chaperone DnaJ [Actinomycetota bacterium]